MIRLGELFARINRRIQPDPMVLACLLTMLVAAVAIVWPQTDTLRAETIVGRGVAVTQLWFDGIWNPNFLRFALQMCFVLLTGFGLAKAPAATRLLEWLASGVKTNRGAVILVAAVSCAACWINWGFGLIVGGLLASQVRDTLARQGKACRFALVVAAAYAGMMIWHGGLSGSAPLKVAGSGVTLQVDGQAQTTDKIPVTRTVLSPINLGLTLLLLIMLPLVAGAMAETDAEDAAYHAPPSSGAPPPTEDDQSLADRVNHSRVVPILISIGLLIALGERLRNAGAAAINLDFVNSVFLSLGLLLHRNLMEYLAAVAEGGRSIVGIVMQFPLYSGIQGIMASAGLAAALSSGFVDLAAWVSGNLGIGAGITFPTATFFSAGIVNFFVPSGGGQWIVQGPIMCTAGHSLGLPIEQTIMAVSYGDQWTNMVQPFWAIPLMGLTGVNTRQFMGYCALFMLLAAPVFLVALYLM